MSLLFDSVVGPSLRIHEQQRQRLEDQKETLNHRVQDHDTAKDLEKRHVGIPWTKETAALLVNSKGGKGKSDGQSRVENHAANDPWLVVVLGVRRGNIHNSQRHLCLV